MAIPNAPADLSGGYMVITYNNALDTHRMRVHVRPFDAQGTYLQPSAAGEANVAATFTNLINYVAPHYNQNWTFKLSALFQRQADGTFLEIYGWTAPAAITGPVTGGPDHTDQSRAIMTNWNFKDGFGGRARLCFIGSTDASAQLTPVTIGGDPAGDTPHKMVDYLSTASKTNVVAHSGHVLQSPAHVTWVVNKKLRRHMNYA